MLHLAIILHHCGFCQRGFDGWHAVWFSAVLMASWRCLCFFVFHNAELLFHGCGMGVLFSLSSHVSGCFVLGFGGLGSVVVCLGSI